MARTRTTKWLSQRIQAQYYRRPHWLRTLRRMLAWALPILCLVWLGAAAVRRETRERPYSPGPLTAAHAALEARCAACHGAAAPHAVGTLAQSDLELSCVACHPRQDAVHAVGQSERATEPTARCTGCHLEHGGRGAKLRLSRDAECTTCHADLDRHRPARALSPATDRAPVAARVTAFAAGAHPQFASVEKGEDVGRLSFNHRLHMHLSEAQRETPGAATNPHFRRLTCLECHQPDSGGALMRAVDFARTCHACHALLTPSLPGVELPHQPVAVIVTWLRGVMDEALAAQPEIWKDWRAAEASRLSHFAGLDQPVCAAPAVDCWKRRRIESTVRELSHGLCSRCHTFATGEGKPDRVEPVSIPERLLPRARFSHARHTAVACEDCHRARMADGATLPASQSKSSRDLLLAGIEVCVRCHRPGGAFTQCARCHAYHADARTLAARGGRDKELLERSVMTIDRALGVERSP